jgi:hypothetical protein
LSIVVQVLVGAQRIGFIVSSIHCVGGGGDDDGERGERGEVRWRRRRNGVAGKDKGIHAYPTTDETQGQTFSNKPGKTHND